MVLMEIENFDFLLPVSPNLFPKINCSPILIKIDKMND